MRKNFVSVKVYEKKFCIYYLKKFSKCKSVWEKIFYLLFEKKFVSVSVWENIL